MTSVFLLVGTYEEVLFGYRYDHDPDQLTSELIKLIFNDHSHSGSLRSVAISKSGRYFISGGTDETLQLFSNAFDRPRQLGNLHEHESTIGSLRFINDDRLLSTDASGKLCIWNTSNFTSPIHRFPKTHKKCGPTDLAIHPSGRLALTIGQDKTMRIWDLVRLRQAACVPCDGEPIAVLWTSSGDAYGILYSRRFEIFETTNCQQLKTFKFDASATSAAFIGPNCVCIGFLNGQISSYQLDNIDPSIILDASPENGRVKSLRSVGNDQSGLLASASSAGWLRLFRYSKGNGGLEFEQLLVSLNVGARITCMDVAVSGSPSDDQFNGTASEMVQKKVGKKKKDISDGQEKTGKKKRKLNVE